MIINSDAFAVVQESVDESPWSIVPGAALKVQSGALGGGGSTPIESEQVTDPPGPVKVAVYVCEEVGVIVLEPDATGVVVPTPWLINPLVAFVEVQEMVALWPLVIESGLIVSVQVGATGGGGTVMVS